MFDPALLIVFGTLFLSLVASLSYAVWYQNLKHKRGRALDTAPESVTVSELQGLIRDAVREATTSIEQRLEDLEQRVDRREQAVLPPHDDRELLTPERRVREESRP